MKKTDLDEWLDLAALSKSFCAHALGDFAWVALDPSNDGMRVGTLLCALIELLDHDSLLPCLPPLEDDSDLARLVNYRQRSALLSIPAPRYIQPLASDHREWIYWSAMEA